MRLKSFEAPTLKQAMDQIRASLGEDALIVATDRAGRGTAVRVTAAIPDARETSDVLHVDPREFNGTPTKDPVPLLRNALADNGVREELSLRLLEAASLVPTPVAPALALAAALDTVFDFSPMGKTGGRVATGHGLRRATLLVGPPGAGKTVSAAKLAARAHAARNTVHLATIDTVKTGGIEHLAALADALEIEMTLARNPRELTLLIAGAGGDVTIVDSAGINPFDEEEAKDLARFLDAAAVEPVLVLPAGLDRIDAVETALAFARMGCRRMVLTRLDMTRRLGGTLEAAYESGLAFSDISVSPAIVGEGGGLAALNPVALARLMLPAQLLHDRDAEPAAKERVSLA